MAMCRNIIELSKYYGELLELNFEDCGRENDDGLALSF